MTEQEWLACTDPFAMLAFSRLRATDRQLRLFACACCRLLWDQLPGDVCRQAIGVAEQYADDLVGEEERARVHHELNRAIRAERGARGRLGQAVAEVLRPRFRPEVAVFRAWIGRERAALHRVQCDLLRDILGSPFRRYRIASSIRDWQGGRLVAEAERIYQERAFHRLPGLARGLEQAGCASEEILMHLRSSGPHVRGCWALDLVRGAD